MGLSEKALVFRPLLTVLCYTHGYIIIILSATSFDFLLQTAGSALFIIPLLVKELRAMWNERQALRHQL